MLPERALQPDLGSRFRIEHLVNARQTALAVDDLQQEKGRQNDRWAFSGKNPGRRRERAAEDDIIAHPKEATGSPKC